MKWIILGLMMMIATPSFGVDSSQNPEDGKGAPIWLWAVRAADVVAHVNIKFDSEKFLVIDSSRTMENGNGGPVYYIEGRATFHRIHYANSNSRYAQNYSYYIKHLNEEQRILIPADSVYFTHMKKGELRLIPQEELKTNSVVLCGLNQVYVWKGLVKTDAMIYYFLIMEVSNESSNKTKIHNRISRASGQTYH